MDRSPVDDLITSHNLTDIINSNVIHDEISDRTINNIIQRINLTMKIKGIKKIDVLLGGPPCQAVCFYGRLVQYVPQQTDLSLYTIRSSI
ncbi:MAG: hypothetical protein SV062_01675, partial [Thermodesulfobacteriota bacterium]|nr:hypothetical protein [Thermodesulfobacteriota bacterium]